MMSSLLIVVLLGGVVHNNIVSGFVPLQRPSRRPTFVSSCLHSSAAPLDEEPQVGDGAVSTRREAITTSVTGLSAALLLAATTSNPQAVLAADIGTSKDSPIVVLGAGGKVGKLCTQILSGKGLYVRAVTRQGRTVLDADDSADYVTYASGDVTNLDSVSSAVAGASGVIFAASASGKGKGGDPAHVDFLGAANTAKACISAKVPKLVLVSAGTVSRPDSAGFQATNFFVKYVYGDFIMDYKIAGEAAVRDLYKGSGLHYCVIRPGGLSDKPSIGSQKVHISQGDVYSSEISREDVALVCVEAVLSPAADDSTFELNQVEGLAKAEKTLPDLSPDLIHTGASSFDGLLKGLYSDSDLKTKYPDIVNDGFRGRTDKILPLEKIV